MGTGPLIPGAQVVDQAVVCPSAGLQNFRTHGSAVQQHKVGVEPFSVCND